MSFGLITPDMIEAAAAAIADMDNVPRNVNMSEGAIRMDVLRPVTDWHRMAAAAALRTVVRD